ncbi:MAG: TetR/AcrR family transcriptional regulator [Clostridia bacterium]|nr:TetR/AcrR family transcriptional regulator [Clostridia bacterium]
MSETSRKIIQGVTELGAENGMYGMTSKLIAKKCECSEGVIFKHFNTLDELKKEVYYDIDNEIYQSIKDVNFDENDIKSSVWQIWNKYFDFLLAHPVKTKYYKNFRASNLYTSHDHSSDNDHYHTIMNTINSLSEKFGLYKRISYDVLWFFIIDNSLSFALRISDGTIENSEITKKSIFNIIFNQIIEELKIAEAG